eukprot:7969618-Heterocapsa_arctica.AAC.1
MREWRWSSARLLTHMAEPPWHQIGWTPQKDAVRPLSRLADQSWMAICISYVKDVGVIYEAEKKHGVWAGGAAGAE